MILDNSQWVSADIKKVLVDPTLPHCCRGSGKPSHFHSSAELNDCKPASFSMAHISRPFPPSSLAGVPSEYILDQLHNLAPHYWNNPDTADCTIVIPVPHHRCKPLLSHSPSGFAQARPSYDPSGLGRRVTEPTLNFLPRISLKLHSDYLSAHSNFLRTLFSGSSPFDLINPHSPLPNSPLRTSSGHFTIPTDRLPRLLNTSAEHPVLFLPVPDPTSIELLFHWMYFGDLRFIYGALEQNLIEWEGIARNVEYLGLPDEIKIFLGRWYRHWLCPDRAHYTECASDEEDSETTYSDDEDLDLSVDGHTLVSDIDEPMKMDVEDKLDEGEPSRGRTRAIRGLSWTLKYADHFPDSSLPSSTTPPSPAVSPHSLMPC